MGQTQGVVHQQRRDEPRTRLHGSVPVARLDTILRAIDATLDELADLGLEYSARKEAQERLRHLKRLAGWL